MFYCKEFLTKPILGINSREHKVKIISGMPFLAWQSPLCCSVSVWFAFQGPRLMFPAWAAHQTGVLLFVTLPHSGCTTCLMLSPTPPIPTVKLLTTATFQTAQRRSKKWSRSGAQQLFSTSDTPAMSPGSFSGSSWVVQTFCFMHVSPGFSPDTSPYPSAAPCHRLLSAQ